MNSKVSVIVPVYNVEDYIAATVKSVLDQSFEDIELILVDDSSTDNSTGVINTFLPDDRIKLLKNTGKKGAAGARNTGVASAAGRYIAFLDSDDLWDKEKLRKQTEFMRRKNAAFSFTGYEFANENGEGLGKVVRVPAEITYSEALKNTTIFTSTVMFDMEKLGKDDILMPCVKSEDTATWWRILRSGIKAYGLDENLTLYRRIGSSLSSNKIEALRRIWNLYRNVEHLSFTYSAYCFCAWAVRAVARRV